ncbi:MAG: hypothetical protein COB62_03365 [Piscirickettsiaceae bacterium]|nr:MAG: hypothetical protein COB62_03365 [Piscirickettsiaceae bacterium]
MPPLIKYLVIIVLITIVYNLFKAFYHLSKRKSSPKDVLKALVVRIGLSIALFISLLMASYFGLIKPHGLVPQPPVEQQPVTDVTTRKQ